MCMVKFLNYEKVLKGKTVLENINLELKKGRIYGIQGHNGCGKTMLLRAISGLITASGGMAVIDGKQLKKDIDFPPSIGVLIENPEFWKQYTGFQVLKTLADMKGEIGTAEINRAIDRVGLNDVQNTAVGKYSLGMRQRLGIAQAIMEKPDILLLDEPTNALDQDGIGRFVEIVKEERARGALVVIVSHDAQSIKNICDKVITMENGRIIAEEEIADA